VSAADLVAAIAQAKPEDVPALALAVAARLAQVGGSMTAVPISTSGNGKSDPEPEHWLTPQAAAAIAAVPETRIYAWARGQRWATRPSRRCLRIDEGGFRRWLAAKGR